MRARSNAHLSHSQGQHSRVPHQGITRATRSFGAGDLVLYDLHDKIVSYKHAWGWQTKRAPLVAAQDRCQALVLLQHSPVYTLGTGSTLDHLKFDVNDPPHPLFRTERGGEVTYHGPGQLVIYPIIDLKQQGQDLHKYLRQLEGVVIRALKDVSGIHAFREDGLTGALLAWSTHARHAVAQSSSLPETFGSVWMQEFGFPVARSLPQASAQQSGSATMA
jgi:hypothetical protein